MNYNFHQNCGIFVFSVFIKMGYARREGESQYIIDEGDNSVYS